MTHPSRNANPEAADRRGTSAASPPTSRVRPYALDIVPIGPNLFAAISAFIVLLAAPWFCLSILEAVWEEAIGQDQVANHLILVGPEEAILNAAVGAALFVVIGAILQTWHYLRPFPSRLPIVLAFPIAWAFIMPEALLAGGSVLSGAVVGTAIALAFAVHWGMLTLLSELRE